MGEREIRGLVGRVLAADAPVRERSAAFGELVRRYQDVAYASAFGILGDEGQAEDAVQEAFLVAWQQLHRLQDTAAFPGWLRQIVRTRCTRRLRSRGVAVRSLEAADSMPAPDGDPADAFRRRHLRATVRAAVEALPESERMAVSLFYLGEHSQREVAAFLELPVTTVQKRLFTARRRLRARLEAALTEPGAAKAPAERMIRMAEESLETGLRAHQPSRDDRVERIARLFGAAAMGDAPTVRAVLADDPTLAQSRRRGQWGERTPLHLAAEKGHLDVVRALLEAGADVHARDEGDNATPLHWAAGEGHLEVIEQLIAAGALVNDPQDVHERGPLGWAISLHESRPEAARLLMAHGAKVDIFAALALEDGARIREMVRADPSLLSARMSRFEDHQPPLHFAVSRDQRAMVELLLELGADIEAVTPTGRSALCAAAEAGKQEMVALLAARGARVDLQAALTLEREPEIARLLEEPLAQEQLAHALGRAAHRGHLPAVTRLLERGAPVDSRSHQGWQRQVTPLIAACDSGKIEVARLLLEKGADVTLVDEYPGATALHYGAWGGNADLVRMLLDRGADLTVKDRMFDADPVGWAAENRQAHLLDLFLEYGARVPLARLAYFGRLDLSQERLRQDPACVDERDAYGTGLHQAALHGHPDVVRLLLEHGADREALNRNGETVQEMLAKARAGVIRPSDLPAHAQIEAMLRGEEEPARDDRRAD
jgi:RNA polymerase sigma factor (sigma-70 family)